jgi:tRNA pseudouridine38-40 synthase
MVVAYDGSGFHGVAVNDGVRTVAGDLAAAIGRFLGHEIELTVAGRTDAGVHARGQVVTFDADAADLDLDGLLRSVNHQCGPAIAAHDATVVPPEFDARFSARTRRYRYLVLNRPHPDPFLAPTSWHVERPLDRWAMELACDPFIGEHDFAAYCRRPKLRDGSAASLVRRVHDAAWTDEGDGLLRFEIEAGSFCHQMVRSIVGTMVAVGHGRLRAGDVAGVIRSGDRSKAGDLAPPQGLTLWSVTYDGWAS